MGVSRVGPEAEPTVTASSTKAGSSASNVVDTGSASSPGGEWRSDRETSGAWVELSWRQPQTLRQVVVVRNPLDQPGVTDGFLAFGDGSYLQVRLSPTSQATVVPITPRSVDRLRFTASAVSSGAQDVAISEFVARDARSGDEVAPDNAAAATRRSSPRRRPAPGRRIRILCRTGQVRLGPRERVANGW